MPRIDGDRFLVKSNENEYWFQIESEAREFMEKRSDIDQQLYEYKMIKEPRWWKSKD